MSRLPRCGRRSGVWRTCRAEAARRRRRKPDPRGGLEISFKNDPCVLDGRFSNNGWLQELPKPITRLTWDNAVFVSPATAQRLKGNQYPAYQGGEHGQIIGDVVDLKFEGRSVRGTLFTVAGHPDDCVTVHVGYGRTRAGRVGTGAGFNANAIRTSSAWSFGAGAEIALTGERASLACVQYHHLMEGRGMVRAVTLEEYAHDPKIVARRGRNAAEDADALHRLQIRRLQVGHGDRPQRLHRLQRLRRRLPGGEQHSGDR